jgi:hypothetical protein
MSGKEHFSQAKGRRHRQSPGLMYVNPPNGPPVFVADQGNCSLTHEINSNPYQSK